MFALTFKYKVSQVEEILRRFLPSDVTQQRVIAEAMEYALMGGGKRLRPIFMAEVYELFGGTQEDEIQPFMAAIEMIHSYSLVHDDLPAMDNDDYRRGRETTHKVYGEAMGILAGDALLNYAFETACKAFETTQDPAKVGRAVRTLAEGAGLYGMLGGQVVDVAMEGKPLTEKQIDFIYRLKTGALIETAMKVGAILAGASDEQVETIGRIAMDIGMAFQIRDDVLDVEGDTEKIGKPVGSDEKNGKCTYVTLFGLEEAKKKVEEYSDRALLAFTILEEDTGRNEFLEELIVALIARER
ncbi:MAG: polyprenyl synthetase family protein [Lachnospiraceae bacterium]|nr:polyprenyl synthetase family protein [Lachnospiraceae bacterium]MBQ9562312.1 polyprenyl synthetase family protein [Lachnospiraceae bacterium]MBR0153789.1 polyprenyl synthetase family protein [Lachnospiraceae bacterium]